MLQKQVPEILRRETALGFAGRGFRAIMNWLQRKIYLYNVTFGLYMLDWWERYLFSILDALFY